MGNNYEKTRNVLKRCHAFLGVLCRDGKCDDHCSECLGASDLADDVFDVLALPPRNCDVGTPKEQSARYEKFCFNHRSRERCCQDCPLLHEPSCELAWAQMTYVEETAPDRDIPLDIDHILAQSGNCNEFLSLRRTS